METVMQPTFDFLSYAFALHWLPLVLSVVFLALSLLQRLRISPPGVEAYMESCSWLMFVIWAFQANGLVYELFETPHALIYVEVLPAVFRDVLGSYGVGAVLILVELLAVRIAGEVPRKSERSRAFDLSEKLQKSTLFLVLLQVVINSWLTMIIALEFAG